MTTMKSRKRHLQRPVRLAIGAVLAATVALTSLTGCEPAKRDVAVAGDSLAFDVSFRFNGDPVGVVHPGVPGAGMIGCGLLAADSAGWKVEGGAEGSGDFGTPANGQCATESVAQERRALRDREVVVLIAGAWEARRVQGSGGTIMTPETPAMRAALAEALDRRIDRIIALGVDHIVLPEWTCGDTDWSPRQRSGSYRAWFNGILRDAAAARPEVTTVKTTSALCVDGVMTAAHRAVRSEGAHWGSPEAARFFWQWVEPGIRQLPA
jgi:hypothetical protein